jgi:hypothetical protein
MYVPWMSLISDRGLLSRIRDLVDGSQSVLEADQKGDDLLIRCGQGTILAVRSS